MAQHKDPLGSVWYLFPFPDSTVNYKVIFKDKNNIYKKSLNLELYKIVQL